MSNDLDIPFERVSYRNGQLLTTRDMEDDRQRDAWLRRLHSRYQHDTWGIALGVEIKKTNDNRGVQVQPFHAVDASGRDLLLAQTIQFSVPEVAGPENYVLTASYQEDSVFRRQTGLKNVCPGGGLNPRLERPGFKWRRPDDVLFGAQVPLVQVTVADGQIEGDLDRRVQRFARPSIRPHIGSGETEQGRSGWQVWRDAGNQILGLEIKVNTSEAGFTKTPFYFATLHGDSNSETTISTSQSNQKNAQQLDGLRFVTDTRQDGFTYRIIRTDQFPAGAQPSAAQAEEREWYLSWFGLEPVTGCEPTLYQLVFFASGFPITPLSTFANQI